MIDRWVKCLNCLLVCLALLFAIAGFAYWFYACEAIACSSIGKQQTELPKGSFELTESSYYGVGGELFFLEQEPIAIQIPDLKPHLIYYGKNGRPDATEKEMRLHFALASNNKEVVSMPPGEKIYLSYDKSRSPGKYVFSQENQKTSLWIEGQPVGNEAEIQVSMERENGERVSEPQTNAHFRVAEKDYSRFVGSSWEINSFRVDGTLFARQKARWWGTDRFLEKHGGQDFGDVIGKQRIDLGENETLYSIFVAAGDCLIWDGSQWKRKSPGIETQGYPLLVVKKVDEKLMNLEVWDKDGKGKIAVNLLKSTEPWTVQNAQIIHNSFKFLGSKTKTQCVFEINRERVILKPSDWLVQTPKGWKKLQTEQEIDDYVKRKLTGALFVFEDIVRKGEKQVMHGSLYSPSRHECQPVEIALQVKDNKASKDGKDKAKEGAESTKTPYSSRFSTVQRDAGQQGQAK